MRMNRARAAALCLTLGPTVVGAALTAGCTRVTDPHPRVPLTKFDWAPPCRVPVTELRQDDDDARRIRYVIDVRQGAGAALEVRLQDFHLLELNGEDMTGPDHASQAPGLIVVDAMVPVLYVGA